MTSPQPNSDMIYDLFIIGGGINGCGIARDAAGRGLTVALAEMGDLGQGTSSRSTKLFHGGLRYLEYFEIGLVAKALREREVLLRAMPHIARPMRFVLPLSPAMRFDTNTPAARLLARVMPWAKGRRPTWLIRLGLRAYDSLGGRKILPATRSLNLRHDAAGATLKPHYTRAFEYSDVWVDDARLVALNARDGAQRGAQIMVQTKVTHAARMGDVWHITTQGPQGTQTHRARALINAGGPWAIEVLQDALALQTRASIRLVRGSHIVTRRLFDHNRAYFLQGRDGRIMFMIPYEDEFTLIGTTDVDHQGDAVTAACSDAELAYMIEFANQYLAKPISAADIVWSYAGVRPLYNDGAASAQALTRDYVLQLDDQGAPLLNIFGGKITTYRKLAEEALDMLGAAVPMAEGWTEATPLPGGNFPHDGMPILQADLARDYPFLPLELAARLLRAYGTDTWAVLGAAKSVEDLGRHFGAGLYMTEVRWLITHEFARAAEDVIWRRSKLGLHMSSTEVAALDAYMSDMQRAPIGV
ncbi:MAG: glycerol-3-phosphate dehydrogenase [Cypionkella sp.]|nr:glycerol-3-phosphate dehydrogenase [Cypionkella sp.]